MWKEIFLDTAAAFAGQMTSGDCCRPMLTTSPIGHGAKTRYAIGSMSALGLFVRLTILAFAVLTIGLGLWAIIAGLVMCGIIAAALAGHTAIHRPDKILVSLVGCVIGLLSLRTISNTLG